MSLDELAGLPGGRIEIDASPEECRALAEAIDLPEIKSLHADVHVLIQPREVTLSGEVVSRLVQTCGVTLDPFETEVREPIDIRSHQWATFLNPRRRGAIRTRLRLLTTTRWGTIHRNRSSAITSTSVRLLPNSSSSVSTHIPASPV